MVNYLSAGVGGVALTMVKQWASPMTRHCAHCTLFLKVICLAHTKQVIPCAVTSFHSPGVERLKSNEKRYFIYHVYLSSLVQIWQITYHLQYQINVSFLVHLCTYIHCLSVRCGVASHLRSPRLQMPMQMPMPMPMPPPSMPPPTHRPPPTQLKNAHLPSPGPPCSPQCCLLDGWRILVGQSHQKVFQEE